MVKEFKSVAEVQREYLPNSVMARLEETVCKELGLTEPHQHRLLGNENSKTGSLEFAKPEFYHSSLYKIIKNFYNEEKYQVRQVDSNSIIVERKNEKYIILIFEENSTYRLDVSGL
jgi:hypothetical protein